MHRKSAILWGTEGDAKNLCNDVYNMAQLGVMMATGRTYRSEILNIGPVARNVVKDNLGLSLSLTKGYAKLRCITASYIQT